MALLHTCYRITDIDRSVAFYRALGFEEVRRLPIREEAINVFLNQPGDGDEPKLELADLASQGIEPERPPYRIREDGGRICFVRDPDGYRVEVVERSEQAP